MKQINMKLNFIILIVTNCISVITLTSCGSHTPKQDDAFDQVKKVRMLSNDSNFTSQEILNESMKTEPDKKIEKLDEWTKFRNEMENKIHKNEKKITEIKSLPEANARSNKKLKSLEQENNDLRIAMDQYNEEVKVKWETFKASMNYNVNEIDIELKAMETDNKK